MISFLYSYIVAIELLYIYLLKPFANICTFLKSYVKKWKSSSTDFMFILRYNGLIRRISNSFYQQGVSFRIDKYHFKIK